MNDWKAAVEAQIHETYCTSVLDDHKGECPGKPEDSPEMTAFRDAVAAPKPGVVEVTPGVFEKWSAEEKTLSDGSEGTLSTALVINDHRVEHPTVEVVMEHPSGLRVSMTAEVPEGSRDFNLAEDLVDHCKRAYDRAKNHLA